MGPIWNFHRISSYSLVGLNVLAIVAFAIVVPVAQGEVVNVRDYGAVPDGKTDNREAFESAWEEACEWEHGNVKVMIPKGSYLTRPVTFRGPCKGPIVLQLDGIVEAPSNPDYFPTTDWIVFRYLSNLTIVGDGKFHGHGDLAWTRNHCRTNTHNCVLPTSVKLAFVNDSTVEGITSVDSKMFHMLVYRCNNIRIKNVRISAAEDSPNTDGIHISASTNVNVTGSDISTGDDCISIGPGTDGVFISKVRCGPGHGISIGSLGKGEHETDVSNIRVSNCTFTRTMNGVRIKSWKDSHVLKASNFVFYDLIMIDASNPIIIDQEYCPLGGCTNQPASRVEIESVKFRKIWGTSNSEFAVVLKCSSYVPCREIELEDINLTYSGTRENVVARALCSNVFGASRGTVIPPSCL